MRRTRRNYLDHSTTGQRRRSTSLATTRNATRHHPQRRKRDGTTHRFAIPHPVPPKGVGFTDPLSGTLKTLADLTLRNRLPPIYPFREFVDMGWLISYGASLNGQWRRAAPYVDKILKGADPGELPIDQPTRFELVINLSTAKMLGIEVPATLLIS